MSAVIPYQMIKLNYLCLFFGLGMSSGIIFSRLVIRLPRDLEIISIFFFLMSFFITIFLLLRLKKLLRPRKSLFANFRLYKYLNIKLMNCNKFIENSYLTAYSTIFLNKKFPEIFYLYLHKIYDYLLYICKNHNFFIIFFFYFLPQLLLPIIFLIEIIYFHKLKIFYLFAPFYLISLIFKILYLQALIDYAGSNFLELNVLLKPVVFENKTTYEIRPAFTNDSAMTTFYPTLCQAYIQTEKLMTNLSKLHNVYEIYKIKFQILNLILYFLGWLHIIIYFLYNIWLFPWFYLVIKNLV
jgi:hypothetical protein